MGSVLRRDALMFQPPGDDAQFVGDLAGDDRRNPRRVQAVRVRPDRAQPSLDFRPGQIGVREPVAQAIGEGGVTPTRTGKSAQISNECATSQIMTKGGAT